MENELLGETKPQLYTLEPAHQSCSAGFLQALMVATSVSPCEDFFGLLGLVVPFVVSGFSRTFILGRGVIVPPAVDLA